METRAPAVAGSFYPADPDSLREQIEAYLAAAKPTAIIPKALIGPHAGTIYSGAIAASAYIAVRALKEQIKRVILLGPAHYVPLDGLAASRAEAFATPLGEIPIDQESIAALVTLPQVAYIDEAQRPEHSLELHLPFLQMTLGDFKLVPLVVGQTEPAEVATVLEAVWGGPETLIVVSSDLSHYLPYERARQIDRVTTEAIEQLQWEELSHEQACGYYPVRGLLQVARDHRMTVTTLDLRNSGDTAGTKEGVVGYGAYVFEE